MYGYAEEGTMRHRNLWVIVLLIFMGLQLGACAQASTEEEEFKPVQLEPIEGTDLHRVILTEEAAKRIDIQMAEVGEEQIGRNQVAQGEVIASPKLTTMITASASGTVLAPPDASITDTGSPVSAGQMVFRLTPFTALSAGSTDKSAVNLEVPADSVLLRLLVSPGQFVEAGQPLFEIADTSKVWIRVPMNQSELARVDRGQSAQILLLESDDADLGLEAEAIEESDDTEFDANEQGDTDDTLYYGVDNKEHSLSLGQRVEVKLALSGNETPRKVVPYDAVIYGQHGETWVFVNPEPLVFVRQPIVIDYIEGDRAVLSEGPDAGTAVVVVGAEELYGSEVEFAEE
jgi:multidrug efflux pump subunit AcrA (membrane-fusion protein)